MVHQILQLWNRESQGASFGAGARFLASELFKDGASGSWGEVGDQISLARSRLVQSKRSMAKAWCAAILALIATCALSGVAALEKAESASSLLSGAREAVGVNPVPDCKSVIVHDQIQSRLNALSSAYANNDLEAVLRLYAEVIVAVACCFYGLLGHAKEESCLFESGV